MGLYWDFKAIFLGGLLVIFSIVVAVSIYFYTKKSLQQLTREVAALRRDFMNYQKSYIKTCIFVWLMLLFSITCEVIGTNRSLSDPEVFYIEGIVFNLGRLGNTCKVMMPVLFFFIRIQDPLIKKRVWTPWRALKESVQNISRSRASTSHRTTSVTDIDQIDALNDCLLTQEDNLCFMDLLPSKIKESITRTFLACISMYYPITLVKDQNDPTSNIIVKKDA